MTQRSAEELSQFLELQDHYFGGENSESEEDFVEDDYDNEDVFNYHKYNLYQGIESHYGVLVDSDNEINDSVEKQANIYPEYIYKHKWYLTPPETRERQWDIMLHSVSSISPGAKNQAVYAKLPLEVWSLFFSDELLEIVLRYTNQEIKRYRKTENCANATFIDNLNMAELKAFIGLLYFNGMEKKIDVTIEELWSADFESMLYRTTMSRQRFEFIAARLRFADKFTRVKERRDLLEPVRDIWNIFIKNCRENYTPSEFLTLDEQFLEFEGKFGAKVYMKNNPERCGIKITSLNDAKTFYMYNAIPYPGRGEEMLFISRNRETFPNYYVRTLCEPISCTTRNVTCNNSYINSVEIFSETLRDYQLTMVGILEKRKTHIPESFDRWTSAGAVRCAYDDTNVLLSYCSEKHICSEKVSLFLSSYHKNGATKNKESDKPEIIDFYNKTKDSTDIFKQLCTSYTCARKTNRWSLRFFLGMLDQAAVNSCILYNFNPEREMQNQRIFLKDLAISLIVPHLRERFKQHDIHKAIKLNIIQILMKVKIKQNKEERENKLEKRK